MPNRRIAIRSLKRIETPSRLVYFDTESRAEREDNHTTVHRLNFGVMSLWTKVANCEYAEADTKVFHHPYEFWYHLQGWVEKQPMMVVCCHNAHFDWRMIDIVNCHQYVPIFWHPMDAARSLTRREEVEYHDRRIPIWSIQPRATFMYLHHRHGTLLCVDSLNYFPMSLKRIGEFVGLPKLTMPAMDAPQSQWEDYCRRDVEIGASAVTKLWSTLEHAKLGTPGPTLASTAMRCWRTVGVKQPLLIPDRPGLRETHRQAYYGGHVDVGYLGEYRGQVFVADVRSLYPFVMRNNLYPSTWLRAVHNVSIPIMKDYLRRYEAIADVSIYSPTLVYPLRLHNRVRYVRGHLRTWLAGPELRDALDHDCITHCHEIHLFRRDDLFSAYIDKVYGLREQSILNGNDSEAVIYKLLMNALYGKFGQRGVGYEYRYDPYATDDAWTESRVIVSEQTRIEVERFGPLVRRSRPQGEATYAHPAIAAYVTSYGRIHMARWKRTIGKGAWLYSDTDSLMLTICGHARWLAHGAIVGSKLGQWSLAGPYSGLVVCGKKDYALGCNEPIHSGQHDARDCSRCGGKGWIQRIKGVRTSATEITGDERRAILAANAVPETSSHGLPTLVLRQALWHGLADVWASGWAPTVKVEDAVKILSREFTDGYVSSGLVEPLYLEMGDQAFFSGHRAAWDNPPGTQPASPLLAADTNP